MGKLPLLGFVLFLMVGVPFVVYGEVYLSRQEALDLVLGKDCIHRYEPRSIDENLREKLRRDGVLGDNKTAHFFICEREGIAVSYALIDSEIGKHLPITYIVGISNTGDVTRVEMMVFREIRGWEVRERRFMSQFEGKRLRDELSIGSSLGNVTGATLSSRAIAKGVQRALSLWNHFYGRS